jgi:hypothetical protein
MVRALQRVAIRVVHLRENSSTFENSIRQNHPQGRCKHELYDDAWPSGGGVGGLLESFLVVGLGGVGLVCLLFVAGRCPLGAEAWPAGIVLVVVPPSL